RLQAIVRPRRRRMVAVAAVSAGALALLWTVRARGPDCDGAAALGDAWTPARRDAIAERVQQLGLPYGAQSLAVIERELDGWATQWREHYDARCRSTAPDRDAVLSCLAELRAGLSATVDALERVDATRLPHAVGSVDALPRPARCEREVWRLAQDAAATGLRQAAAEVAALDAAGEYDAALAAARALWARASAPEHDGDPALQALAQRLLGGALERDGDYDEAAAMLTSAAYLALRSGDDALAAGTMADLVKVLGTDLGRVDEAEAWARHAEAALARLPAGDPMHAAVRNAQGLLAIESGDGERAVALLGEAVALLREDDGGLDVRRSFALNNYANALLDAGRFDDARAAYERALALRERRLGSGHPQVASTLSNLGLVAERQGDTVAARQFHERAIAVARAGLGEDHPTMAELTNNLAVLDYSLGDIAQAKAGFERTLALVRRSGSRGHRAVARVLGNLALCATESGDPAAALPLLDEALALQLASLGPDHPDVAMTLNNRGSAQRRLGRFEAAAADYGRALEIRTAVLGEQHGERAQTLDNLGLVALAQGDAAQALALHEQALAIFTAVHGERHDKVAGALVHRSEAERALGQREAALASARRARAILEAVTEPDPIELARAQLAEAAAEPEREAARRLARQALAALQREGARADAEVADARALLERLGG
ncbi:MAG: tetratricopeptide repeat protein, partial [Nannocystaceae bacterium]|nr:tetratricopeptide repeat protein [Nannocystaceae bacterium]